MRSLILPDTHQKWRKAQKIYQKHKNEVDLTIHLGDWWDSFNPSDLDAKDTAKFVQELLNENVICLFGNHDTHYFWDHIDGLKCSGYNIRTQDILDEYKHEFREKFKLFLSADGWLFSHAGLTRQHYQKKTPFEDYFARLGEEFRVTIGSGMMHWSLEAGLDRGGRAHFGGLTWCDWNSFKPIHGLNQLCGHTSQPDLVRTRRMDDSLNYCIDTGLNNYAIITDGDITIKDSYYL